MTAKTIYLDPDKYPKTWNVIFNKLEAEGVITKEQAEKCRCRVAIQSKLNKEENKNGKVKGSSKGL